MWRAAFHGIIIRPCRLNAETPPGPGRSLLKSVGISGGKPPCLTEKSAAIRHSADVQQGPDDAVPGRRWGEMDRWEFTTDTGRKCAGAF